MSCHHPQCSWLADDPTSYAICEAACIPPVCEWDYSGAGDVSVCGTSPPTCYIRCAPDQCEQDSAPQCETVCLPHATNTDCSPICEATNCAWDCRKPTNAPIPQFQLTCERPAAELDPNDTTHTFRPFPGQGQTPPPSPSPSPTGVSTPVFVWSMVGASLLASILTLLISFSIVSMQLRNAANRASTNSKFQ